MSLHQLPAELITGIVEHVPTARDVAHLSQGSKRLRSFVEADGWKAFSSVRFPSFAEVKHGRDAAIALTGLSRNWDRRALYAHYVDFTTVTRMQDNVVQPWKKPTGQTMGFRPCTDSSEDVLGERPNARLETLVYSAGAQILLRQQDLRSQDDARWLSYRPYEAREGADDITALKLLNSSDDEPSTQVLYGTAAGKLGLLYTTIEASGRGPCTDGGDYSLRRRGQKITSIDVAPSHAYFTTAAENSLALFGSQAVAEATKPSAPPLSTVELVDERDKPTRIWEASFVGERHVAVGVGPCEEPLQVYQTLPTGLSETPIRRFRLGKRMVQGAGAGATKTLAAYAIVPLSDSTLVTGTADHVFLAGYYDGVIRLHDLRSPEESVASYYDQVDDAAIYSLATVARERLVAGSSRHNLLKFFDLRVSGGRNYSYNGSHTSANYNLFLQPPKQSASRPSRRVKDSSVYSLSIPSPISARIYAGIENDIVQMSFVEAPRKIMATPTSSAPATASARPRQQRNRRNNHAQEPPLPALPEYLDLATYDHSEQGQVHLKVQSLEGGRVVDPCLDEIWISTKEKGQLAIRNRREGLS